jgi:hypothetical protein
MKIRNQMVAGESKTCRFGLGGWGIPVVVVVELRGLRE